MLEMKVITAMITSGVNFQVFPDRWKRESWRRKFDIPTITTAQGVNVTLFLSRMVMMFNSPSMSSCILLLAYCSFKDGLKEALSVGWSTFGRNYLPWEIGRWLSAYLVVNPARWSFSFIMEPLHRWAIAPPFREDKNAVHWFPILGPNWSNNTNWQVRTKPAFELCRSMKPSPMTTRPLIKFLGCSRTSGISCRSIVLTFPGFTKHTRTLNPLTWLWQWWW